MNRVKFYLSLNGNTSRKKRAKLWMPQTSLKEVTYLILCLNTYRLPENYFNIRSIRKAIMPNDIIWEYSKNIFSLKSADEWDYSAWVGKIFLSLAIYRTSYLSRFWRTGIQSDATQSYGTDSSDEWPALSAFSDMTLVLIQTQVEPTFP